MTVLFQQTSIMVNIDQLTFAKTNRPLDDENLKSLTMQIAEEGVKIPILINEHGVIINGHHRATVCKNLGIESIEAFVKHGLTEADVPKYNNQDKKWTLENFLQSFENDWGFSDKEIGVAPNIKVKILGFSKQAKSESVDPTTSKAYELYENFKNDVWIPIFENIQETRIKPMRFTADVVYEVSLVKYIDKKRLVQRVSKYWREINSISKKGDILAKVVDVYNMGLRENSSTKGLTINNKGKLLDKRSVK